MALWGNGLYGQNLYSADPAVTQDLVGNLAPTITFNGALDLVGAPFFTGNLRPTITFAGNLSLSPVSLAGNLAPAVTFGASLTETLTLAGDMDPQVSLNGDLTTIAVFESEDVLGGFYFYVNFYGVMTSGPLWEPTTPCDTVEWVEAELCNG